MDNQNNIQGDNINPIENHQIINYPPQKSNIYKYLFFISIIIFLGVIIGIYFILNNKITKLSEVNSSDITPTQTIETDNKITPITEPTVKPTESSLTELDKKNNLYINNKFGFSLTIPKTINIDLGNCKGNSLLTYFEDKNTIHIAAKSFFRLNQQSSCSEENTTLNSILDDSISSIPSLKIYAASIQDDNELEQFIKQKYGSGCKLGPKTLSKNTDIYNVQILSDGKDLGESQCPINFMIDTKYNSSKGKVVIFELGQACNLIKDTKNYDCYDSEVVSSLKFN